VKRFISKYPKFSAYAWSIIIFILCSTPGNYIPSSNWLDLLSFDKFVHASIFFILATLWFNYFKINTQLHTLKIILIIFFCCLYGGLLEIMQAKLFSNRSGDWLDFIANSIGCLIAPVFYSKIQTKLLGVR
jgi:VanZ family protein